MHLGNILVRQQRDVHVPVSLIFRNKDLQRRHFRLVECLGLPDRMLGFSVAVRGSEGNRAQSESNNLLIRCVPLSVETYSGIPYGIPICPLKMTQYVRKSRWTSVQLLLSLYSHPSLLAQTGGHLKCSEMDQGCSLQQINMSYLQGTLVGVSALLCRRISGAFATISQVL